MVLNVRRHYVEKDFSKGHKNDMLKYYRWVSRNVGWAVSGRDIRAASRWHSCNIPVRVYGMPNYESKK